MRIVLPGNPIPKARPKFCVRGRHAMAYDSQAKIMTEKRAELCYLAKQDQPDDLEAYFSHPLSVRLWFHMPVTVSSSAAQKNAKLNGLVMPSIKPDIDNLVKTIFDISNDCLWRDDSQIVELHATQQYSETPCTVIEIKVITMNLSEHATQMMHLFSPAALEKLESDVSCLWSTLESLRLTSREDREMNIETAASAMKAFATTYGLALKKMAGK